MVKAKALKGKKAFLAHLFMKMKEIGEKEGKTSQVSCEEEIEGK